VACLKLPSVFSSESSSSHVLCVDNSTNGLVHFFYYVFNFLNNSFGDAGVDAKLGIRKFRLSDWERYWKLLDEQPSPSRAFSDLFWAALPWESFQNDLGEIHMLDIGCGQGVYAKKFSIFSGDRISSYAGLDVRAYNEWRQFQERDISFSTFDGENLSQHIPTRTNLIVSQSALEHIPKDLYLFQQIHDWTQKNPRPILQLHLIPSAYGLRLFRLHGVRQYTPRTISRITRIFNDASVSILFELGGRVSNELHLKFITDPLRKGKGDRRYQDPEEYAHRLKDAVRRDMDAPTTVPSFYALAVASSFSSSLFHPNHAENWFDRPRQNIP